MKKNFISTAYYSMIVTLLMLVCQTSNAQYLWNNDSAFKAGTPNSGRLWGYIFGDLFYKSHSDSLNRGGNNQYTNVKQSTTEFQFRRIYIGYDYNISKQFSTEFLFAAEDNFNGGDVLQDNKFTPYIKLANLRWKNFLFKGNDLLVGLQPTPSFPYMTESIFSYSRPLERTITDIRRTPSFDFGLGIQGRFTSEDKSVIYGYNFLVANGSSAKPQNLTGSVYKWFYGDAFVGFLNRKLVIDFYADYQRQNWSSVEHGHAARQMNKLAIIWVDKKFTIGTEEFVNGLKQCEVGLKDAIKDTLDGRSTGITFYAHANIVKTKVRAWVRYDLYNPNTKYDNSTYTKYSSLYGVSITYEPNNKEGFLSTGIDYMPVNNVHVMPNVWYNKYTGQQKNLAGAAAKDHDLVWRITFFFTFGKLFANPNYSYYPFLH